MHDENFKINYKKNTIIVHL